MSAKKSNQKKIKKEDIFGLKSYTDGAEMWKFITSELVPLQTPMEFLNDNSFEKRIASDIIETWLSYKNQEISAEDFNYYLNLICQTDYLVGFNFSLYSEKADKWYSSIVFYNNHALEGHECTEEHFQICEELFKLYNIGAITLKATIFFKQNRDIVEEGGEKFRKAFLEFWNDDAQYTKLLKDYLSPFLSI